jgi:hypothetical protein
LLGVVYELECHGEPPSGRRRYVYIRLLVSSRQLRHALLATVFSGNVVVYAFV